MGKNVRWHPQASQCVSPSPGELCLPDFPASSHWDICLAPCQEESKLSVKLVLRIPASWVITTAGCLFFCRSYKLAAVLRAQILHRLSLWLYALNWRSLQNQKVTCLDQSVWRICAYLGGRSETNMFLPPVIPHAEAPGRKGQPAAAPTPANSFVHNISSGAWGDETSLTLLPNDARSWGSLYPTQLFMHLQTGGLLPSPDGGLDFFNDRRVGASKTVLIDGFSI